MLDVDTIAPIAICLLMGGIFTTLGISTTKKFAAMLSDPYERASGVITGFSVKRSKNSTTYTPKYDVYYRGGTYAVKSIVNVKRRKDDAPQDGNGYAVGDNIYLRVYNKDPNTAIIDDEKLINTFKILGIVFGLVGVGILGIAVWLIVNSLV